MKRYTVHRVDHVTRKKVAVGCIVERRGTSRELRQNFLALQAEARELFGGEGGDAIRIVLEFLKPAAVPEERAGGHCRDDGHHEAGFRREIDGP